MGAVLSSVDLVVSRAGINTLTELMYLKKPTLTIPLPYLYQDEQHKNAKFFSSLGLGEILLQSNLNGESFLENIKEMLKKIDKYKINKSSKEIIVEDAAKRVALETILLSESSIT